MEFDDPAAAAKALQMNGHMLLHRPLRILPNEKGFNEDGGAVSAGVGAPVLKTRMCYHFLEGNCRHGDLCNYAHHVSGEKDGWIILCMNKKK